MPELPEVETMRRGTAPAVGGIIADVRRCPGPCRPIEIAPPLASFRRRARGRRIEEVGRIGKRVVLRLDNSEAIVFEPPRDACQGSRMQSNMQGGQERVRTR